MGSCRRSAGLVCSLLFATTSAIGCSSTGTTASTSTTPTTSPGSSTATTVPDGPSGTGMPRVDLVLPAVRALEAKLGAPQQYFEINATGKLVNVIIALNNGAFAQNWVYLDGELTSKDPQPASGNTFRAAALDLDPAAVLTKITTDLPDASPDLFLVEGGPNGIVRYTVVVTSSKGGQLLVVVGADGRVIEVDPD